jgi:hypothetical protein
MKNDNKKNQTVTADRWKRYITSTHSANIIHIHSFREDGIEITIAEATTLSKMQYLPDNRGTVLIGVSTVSHRADVIETAILEFVTGWSNSPEYLRKQTALDLKNSLSILLKYNPEIWNIPVFEFQWIEEGIPGIRVKPCMSE